MTGIEVVARVYLEPFGAFKVAVSAQHTQPLYVRWRTPEGRDYTASFVLDGQSGPSITYRLFEIQETEGRE